MAHKCEFPNGATVRIGNSELDPCVYETVEKYKNVTVEISKCKVCGAIDISWKRQANTEDLMSEDEEDTEEEE